MICVVEASGRQYLIEPGKKIIINKTGKNVGDSVIFDKVLLCQNDSQFFIGKPYLNDVYVEGKIIRNIKKKIKVIRFRPKTRYNKKKGFRYYFDEILIENIVKK
jgi:large subunit ribosomal protein L21